MGGYTKQPQNVYEGSSRLEAQPFVPRAILAGVVG